MQPSKIPFSQFKLWLTNRLSCARARFCQLIVNAHLHLTFWESFFLVEKSKFGEFLALHRRKCISIAFSFGRAIPFCFATSFTFLSGLRKIEGILYPSEKCMYDETAAKRCLNTFHIWHDCVSRDVIGERWRKGASRLPPNCCQSTDFMRSVHSRFTPDADKLSFVTFPFRKSLHDFFNRPAFNSAIWISQLSGRHCEWDFNLHHMIHHSSDLLGVRFTSSKAETEWQPWRSLQWSIISREGNLPTSF